MNWSCRELVFKELTSSWELEDTHRHQQEGTNMRGSLLPGVASDPQVRTAHVWHWSVTLKANLAPELIKIMVTAPVLMPPSWSYKLPHRACNTKCDHENETGISSA